MIPQTHSTQASIGLVWHRLPWNALFWGLTLVLLAAAGFFTIRVEADRKAQKALTHGTAKISDGDTVDVVLVLNGDEIMVERDGERARVRMLGIHSFDPVVNEREITVLGRTSVKFLERRLLDKMVRLKFADPILDVRGRYLAYVERDGIDINLTMVEKGIAMVYTEYAVPLEKQYLGAESLARKDSSGIWGGKKASARIMGLRQQWAISRLDRTGRSPPDYLLEEQP